MNPDRQQRFDTAKMPLGKLNLQHLQEGKRLLREIRLLRTLRHPNVLHLIDMMPPPGLAALRLALRPLEWRGAWLPLVPCARTARALAFFFNISPSAA